jgi:hypothetical protein
MNTIRSHSTPEQIASIDSAICNAKHLKDEKIQWANYCGQTVQVLHVYQDDYGTHALVSYDDGKEEEIPLVRLDLL